MNPQIKPFTLGAVGAIFNYIPDDLYPLTPKPFKNIWIGTKIANQEQLNEWMPLIVQTGIKQVFIEHLPIEKVKIDEWINKIKWVIIAGSNGFVCDIAYYHSIIEQCRNSHIPIYIKRIGRLGGDVPPELINAKSLCSRDFPRWPSELRLRQLPTLFSKLKDARKSA